MKIRVKNVKERIVVDLGDVTSSQFTLKQLKDRLTVELTLPPSIFELSLNGTDVISGDETTLEKFGIVGGDLVTVISESDENNHTSNAPSDRSTQLTGDTTSKARSSDSDILKSSSPSTSDSVKEELPESETSPKKLPNNDPIVNRYLKEPMLCHESVDGGALPERLAQLYNISQPSKKHEALCIVLNVLMLEKGYIPKGLGEIDGDDVCDVMPLNWNARSSVYILEYSHPSCYGITAAITCIPMGDIIFLHGLTREQEQPKCKLQIPCKHYVSTIRKDPSQVYTGLAKLSRVFKDTVAQPVLENMRACVGLEKTSGFSGLANEIKIHILQYLDARSLIRISSVNKDFLAICRERILWRRLYLKTFGSRSDNSLNVDWLLLYREAYIRRRELIEMSRRSYMAEPPHHPHLFAPVHPFNGGIIGGDFDRDPAYGPGINRIFGPHHHHPQRPFMHPRFDPFGPIPDNNFHPGRGGGMFDDDYHLGPHQHFQHNIHGQQLHNQNRGPREYGPRENGPAENIHLNEQELNVNAHPNENGQHPEVANQQVGQNLGYGPGRGRGGYGFGNHGGGFRFF